MVIIVPIAIIIVMNGKKSHNRQAAFRRRGLKKVYECAIPSFVYKTLGCTYDLENN